MQKKCKDLAVKKNPFTQIIKRLDHFTAIVSFLIKAFQYNLLCVL